MKKTIYFLIIISLCALRYPAQAAGIVVAVPPTPVKTVLPEISGIIYGGVVGSNISRIDYKFGRTIVGICTVSGGYDMLLGVTYTGTGTNSIVNYEWSFNGSTIAGTLGQPFITLSGITASLAGQNIQVRLTGRIVYNGLGQYTDNYVYPSQTIAAVPAVVSQSPASVLVCSGNFSVLPSVYINASGSLLSYKWYKNGIYEADPIGSSPATITGYDYGFLSSGSSYRIVAENYCGSATTSGISLTNAPTPTVTLLPKVFCTNNSDRILPYTATGYNLTWGKWYSNGGLIQVFGGLPNSAAVYGELYTTSFNSFPTSSYKVVVTDGCGIEVSTAGINLTVSSPPVINISPVSQKLCPGNDAIFIVSASGLGLSYQWYEGGNSPIENSNTTSITGTYDHVNNLRLYGYQALYNVAVSNQCGNTNSQQAEATVLFRPELAANTIFGDYAGCRGEVLGIVSIFSNSYGNDQQYIWKRNGAVVLGYTVNGMNFTLDDNHIGTYVGMAFNTCGTVTSSMAVLSYADAKIEFASNTFGGISLGTTVGIAPSVTEYVQDVKWYVNTGSGYTLIVNPAIRYCGNYPCNFGPCIPTPMPCPAEQQPSTYAHYLVEGYTLNIKSVTGMDLNATFKFTGNGVCDNNFIVSKENIRLSTASGVVEGGGTTAVEGPAKTDIDLYPNPTEGNFSVVVSTLDSDKIYQITSLQGIILKEGTLHEGTNTIETTLPQGVYLFKTRTVARKLLIE